MNHMGDVYDLGESSALRPLHVEEQLHEAVHRLYTPALLPWETRLLALHTGDLDDPLEATLGTAVLIDERGLGFAKEQRVVEYEALSYTWGGEILSHALCCNGVSIGITRNLFRCLRHLRGTAHVRYLWVDAVCINQLDSEEKARQIRNLQKIFRRAKEVIAWLGEEGDYTGYAVQFLEQCQSSRALNMVGLAHDPDIFDFMCENMDFERTYKGLLDLAQRPWLSRAWVVQEVFAAQLITVQCGEYLMEWDLFYHLDAVIELLRNVSKRTKRFDCGAEQTSVIKPIKFLASIRNSEYHDMESQRRDLFPGDGYLIHNDSSEEAEFFYRLLSDTTHLKATDPRDRIWALLGLTQVPISYGSETSNAENAIHIDYNKPVTQVYSEVTRYLLCSLGVSYYLLFLDKIYVDLPFGALNLPSWCLDFNTVQLPDYSWLTSLPTRGKASVKALGPHSRSWHVLNFTGWHLGTICAVKESSPETLSTFSNDPNQRDLRNCPVLNRKLSIRAVNVEVRNTAHIKRWILIHAGSRLKWEEASPMFLKHCHRDNLNFGERTRERLSQLLIQEKQYVPEECISNYLKQNRHWQVAGEVRVSDVVVQFRSCAYAVVLRQISRSEYTFVGFTRPVHDLILKNQESELTRDFGYPVPKNIKLGFNSWHFESGQRDGGLLEGEEVFSIR